MPALNDEEHYCYLGVPIGIIHNCNNLSTLVQNLILDLEKIGQSLLSPWQKLDAIRTFIQPCLTFELHVGFSLKKSLESYHSTLIKILRKICKLPSRSSTAYFFANKRTGGLGLQDPIKELDVQTIVHAIKMLSSDDPVVSQIARAELLQTVRYASQSNPTPALVSNYLSSQPDDRLNNIRYRVQSLWTRTRKASKCIGITFTFTESGKPTISSPDSSPVQASKACNFLHFHIQDFYSQQLLSLPDQGKVAHSLSSDYYANGSSWHTTGLNMRFKDWRFIHRARLNCIPLNGPKSKWSNASPKCRHCESDETLPHVLCHCKPNMVMIRNRHNAMC